MRPAVNAPVVIAIDGPAASGKGTIARRVAERLGFAHLDTGALYRAVGLLVRARGGDPGDPAAAEDAARALDAGSLAALMRHADLRGDIAAQAASKVGAVPGVRAALMDFQHAFAADPPGGLPGAVLDGRDIGTVVCPDAPAKLFVTAAVDVRARRRFNELLARGAPAIYDAVLEDMKERDARDSQRAVAPLRPAVDAFVLDTSSLDADAAVEAAISFIRSRTGLPR